MTKRLFSIPVFLLVAVTSLAQSSNDVQMAEGLRSSGKIWVVVAVLLLIFIGIIFFMIFLERRVRKLEQEQDK